MEKVEITPAIENTSIANYVWLPLKFQGNRVWIEWLDEWKVENFD